MLKLALGTGVLLLIASSTLFNVLQAAAFIPNYPDRECNLPIEEKLRKFDAVFTAELVGFEYVRGSDNSNYTVAKMRLEQYWKGFNQTDEYALVTEYLSSPSSHFGNVSIGDKFFLYANSSDWYHPKVFGIEPSCDGSTFLWYATNDLKVLGPGTIAANRTDVPSNYLRDFEISFTLDDEPISISGVSIEAIPASAVINHDEQITELNFQEGARGSVEINLPNHLLGTIYKVVSEIDDGTLELGFNEISSTNSTTTLQVYLANKIATNTIYVLGEQSIIASGQAIVLTGVSSGNSYHAKIGWLLAKDYNPDLFRIEIFDVNQTGRSNPIEANYDIRVMSNGTQLLSEEQSRMQAQDGTSKTILVSLLNGPYVIAIENINVSNERIEIPIQVTPEFPYEFLILAGVIGVFISAVVITGRFTLGRFWKGHGI